MTQWTEMMALILERKAELEAMPRPKRQYAQLMLHAHLDELAHIEALLREAPECECSYCQLAELVAEERLAKQKQDNEQRMAGGDHDEV